MNTEDGQFQFTGLPNDKGYLGKLLTAPFQAENRAHAEEVAHHAIASSLSNMSLYLDIPLEVGIRETKELSNGSTSIRLMSRISKRQWRSTRWRPLGQSFVAMPHCIAKR